MKFICAHKKWIQNNVMLHKAMFKMTSIQKTFVVSDRNLILFFSFNTKYFDLSQAQLILWSKQNPIIVSETEIH